MTFKDLDIIAPIQEALTDKGYTNPTPIQEKSIPILLERKDLLGCAQTGTGKTAAFSIPILQNLYLDRQQRNRIRKIKALIVTPTRELAIQIADNFTEYGANTGLKNTVIFGGVKQKSQTDALKRGVDILVATPGRLLDLMNQGFISLKHIEYFVLDEADRMLDMGFVHDIKKLLAVLPKERQSLFFSATMPADIMKLSANILGKHETVIVKPEQTTAERVEQYIYFAGKVGKRKLIVHLLENEEFETALIFTRTKYGADKLVKLIAKAGITAAAIHGNKSQGARQKALGDFKSGKLKVLIATDIAARGIDVAQLSLVINFELPNIAETYVHRIGRTGRAKASGKAISFCAADEKPYLRDIQKLIKQELEVIEEHPFMDLDDEDEVSTKNTDRPKKKPFKKRSPSANKGNQNKSKSFTIKRN